MLYFQVGHQRSFSDRGPQGDRGRTWERNQDRRSWEQDQRGGWDKNQTGFQGGPGAKDQGFSERFQGRRDSDFGSQGSRDRMGPEERPNRREGQEDDLNKQSQLDQHTSWQQQPGNVRDQWGERQYGMRDNSPVARPEDIPFKKPKVIVIDNYHVNIRLSLLPEQTTTNIVDLTVLICNRIYLFYLKECLCTYRSNLAMQGLVMSGKVRNNKHGNNVSTMLRRSVWTWGMNSHDLGMSLKFLLELFGVIYECCASTLS